MSELLSHDVLIWLDYMEDQGEDVTMLRMWVEEGCLGIGDEYACSYGAVSGYSRGYGYGYGEGYGDGYGNTDGRGDGYGYGGFNAGGVSNVNEDHGAGLGYVIT